MNALWVNGLWAASCLAAHARFRAALGNPAAAQERALRRVLRAGAGGRVGRQFGFERIDSLGAFRRRVPLSTYADVAPDVDAIAAGARGDLGREPVERLVPTSGTVSGLKLIPYTRALRREMGEAIGALIVDLFRRHPRAADGPAYWSVSPALRVQVSSAVPVGLDDDAAYLGRALAPLVRKAIAVPGAMRLLHEPERFWELTLTLLAARRDLRLISVWHPSFLELLFARWPLRYEAIADSIRRGRIAPGGVPPELARQLSLAPDPRRAAELLALGPGASLGELFPQLDLVSAWGDASAAGPFRSLTQRLHPIAVEPKGIVATEGFVSLPFAGACPLAVNSHVVELLDGDDSVPLCDVVEGRCYSVVLSTSGGLYRYRLGDRVQVDGFLGKTPSVRFLGREGRVVDLVGEKLAEPFVEQAMAQTFGSARPDLALLAPNATLDGYCLFVDGEATGSRVEQLDRLLCENPYYEHARRVGQLRPLCAVRLRRGAAARLLEHRASEGRLLGGIKSSCLDARTDLEALFSQFTEPTEENPWRVLHWS